MQKRAIRSNQPSSRGKPAARLAAEDKAKTKPETNIAAEAYIEFGPAVVTAGREYVNGLNLWFEGWLFSLLIGRLT